MAEKIKLTQEMLDSGKTFEELGFAFETNPAPYSVLEEASLELLENAYVINDMGFVYKHYRYELEWFYVVLKYFSNLDVEDWGKEVLYDAFYGRYDYGDINIDRLDDMVYAMYDILRARVERENSLDYKLGKLIDTLSNLQEEETKETAEKLISLMDRVNETEKKPVLTMFAKKD